MRLEQLYRIRFTYPEGWSVGLEGGWEQHLFLAEGRCEGSISGRFRGANFPYRRTAAGPFMPDFRAAIDTDDGATVLFECHGYGRADPPGRRQIVGSVLPEPGELRAGAARGGARLGTHRRLKPSPFLAPVGRSRHSAPIADTAHQGAQWHQMAAHP